MAEDLFIPKLGQTVDEVVLINWLVEDGTKVEFGDPVLEVETDKAIFNVEANAKGVIRLGPHKVGETLPVLTVVATIGKANEAFSPSSEVLSPEGEEKPEKSLEPAEVSQVLEAVEETAKPQREKVFASPRARKLANEEGVDVSQLTPTGGEGIRVIEQDVKNYLQAAKPNATPVAGGLAKEVGLSLVGISGSGPKGVITRKDVIRTIREKLRSSTTTPLRAAAPKELAKLSVTETIPLRSVRKLIFDRMGESVHTTARVTLVTEIDATKLVALRERFKVEKASKWGFTPGYNELIGSLVARTLPDFPYVNARINADETSIEHLGEVNLGIAVDTERGLVVPVIKNADQIDLQAFGTSFRRLIDRAQTGRFQPEDLEGGTFTITNLGNFEVDAFTPVINLPQAGILGIGRIQEKVVPIEGEIIIRKMMTLSLVFDHRIIDGAPAARFLQQIKLNIESPSLILE
jgi:pyruvate dehydrogenase E2 component (dihydrolipoamide acetyltransferase)